MTQTYETAISGLRLAPGQWRPHYPFEQIAWISPPWPSQDYLWLDFPEAIFTKLGLLYLSHVNPSFPAMFADLPQVPWQVSDVGLSFERRLPNGVRFGGSLRVSSERTVALHLFIHNGGADPLRHIRLQTCVYLRAIKEFAPYSQQNKFVHTAAGGWLAFEAAKESESQGGRFQLGWRGGPIVADLPVMVVQSNLAERLIAMTWGEQTYSLAGNPHHPCFHADPFFPDLDPGQEQQVQGELIFYEGSLEAFGEWFEQRQKGCVPNFG